MRQAEEGQIVLVASSLVIAEVVKYDSPESPAVQARTIRQFFENDYIKVRAVDRKTAEEAAEICRIHGVKPPDAIHIATALATRCEVLHTYDGEKGEPRKLLAFDGKIGVPALPIKQPATIVRYVQGELPLPTAPPETP